VNAYLEAGRNFIDTSDAYLGGKSEEMLGQFLRGRREDVVLLTKYTRTSERTAAPASTGNHRKAMLQSVHASLKRLQTDCIVFKARMGRTVDDFRVARDSPKENKKTRKQEDIKPNLGNIALFDSASQVKFLASSLIPILFSAPRV
jgi:hypothetical protein